MQLTKKFPNLGEDRAKKRAYEGHRNSIDSFNERLTEIKHHMQDIKRKQQELQEASRRAGQLQTKIELKKKENRN